MADTESIPTQRRIPHVGWLILIFVVLASLTPLLPPILQYNRQMGVIRRIAELRGEFSNTPDTPLWLAEILGPERRIGFDSITQVLLDDSAAHDSDCREFAELHRLVDLRLDGTGVTDEGLRHLADLKRLAILSLNRTTVSDKGVRFLSELGNLEFLYLNQTKITDAGLSHFTQLKRLEFLYLNETQVTDAGIAKLQISLPNCWIICRRR